MHGKCPRACEPGSQRPPESTHTISQWPDGLMRSSRFLILTDITFSQWQARILHRKTHSSQQQKVISQRSREKKRINPTALKLLRINQRCDQSIKHSISICAAVYCVFSLYNQSIKHSNSTWAAVYIVLSLYNQSINHSKREKTAMKCILTFLYN